MLTWRHMDGARVVDGGGGMVESKEHIVLHHCVRVAELSAILIPCRISIKPDAGTPAWTLSCDSPTPIIRGGAI